MTMLHTAPARPTTSAPARTAPAPPVPASLAETGLEAGQIEQLLVKTLHGGEASGLVLAERIRLPYGVLEPLIERLRAERLIEVLGAAGNGSSGYRYALTDLGRERAVDYLEMSRYVGPAPVPLDSYLAYMSALLATRGDLDRERLRQGFSHLIVGDAVLEKLGPAVNAGKAVFLYGAPGNGKTVIAEGMGRTLGGDMYIPHALDVDGHTITMYDPITHVSLEDDAAAAAPSVIAVKPRDRRWIRIRRPVVMVGGELTLEMLDLRFNALSKFYEAPIQLKANGGVFLVDDFGRQRIRPQDLLNRWIVPLESRIDFLTLHTGKKFQVPFDVLIVFATNLDPESLADEAFLRRIPYKIPIPDPNIDEFTRIFELNCRRRKLRFHPVMVAYLQRRHYNPANRPLRACHPRDLLDQVTALCRYRGIEPVITRELIDAACASYFVSTAPAAPQPVRPQPRTVPAKRLDVH
jgi:DNA-binding PadR family transcriptional regulator